MTEKSNVLLPAIINTIKSAKETIAEGMDLIARVATDSEVLNQVPVISVAVKTLNIKDAFARHRLERNCIAFLKAVADADGNAIDKLREMIQADPVYAEDFTDTILSVLVEGQKPIKSELIGKLVIALSRREITLQEFESLSQIIQSASPPALNALPSFFNSTNGTASKQGMGITEEEPLLFSMGIASRSGNSFRVSDLGKKLYVHGFGGQIAT